MMQLDMSDIDGSAFLFASRGDQKDGKELSCSALTTAAFPETFKKATPQRNLRRKRSVEEYEHYVAAVFDENGHCHLFSSPSLKRQKRSILAEAVVRSREILEGPLVAQKDFGTLVPDNLEHGKSRAAQPPLTGSISFPFDTKRRKVVLGDPSLQHDDQTMTGNLEEASSQDVQGSKSSLVKKEISFPTKLRQIRVDDTPGWTSWLLDGFTSIQQTACRTIAKEWIKAIHPKKQSTHPYNGKGPRNEGGSPDPERTRPPYWPPNVRHKEPDHIDKADRTALLVHLLMHTPQDEIVPDKAKSDRIFTARDLLAALQKKQDEGVLSKWRIIEELINARTVVEEFEAGGIDGDAVLSVPDWSEVLRVAGSRKKNTGPQLTRQLEEDGDNPFEEAQRQEDEDMADRAEETALSSHMPFPGSNYGGEQTTILPFSMPTANTKKHTEQERLATSQQPPMQSTFQDMSFMYAKPLASRAMKSRRGVGGDGSAANTLAHQQDLMDGLTSYGDGSWQGNKTEKATELADYVIVSPFSRTPAMGHPSHSSATHSVGPLGHEEMTRTLYADGNNYSFDMNHSTVQNYDFSQLDQYQQLGFGPQYDMARNSWHIRDDYSRAKDGAKEE